MVNDPFRALAHPIRRGIVERLAAGPATVGEVTRGFGVSKPAISKHLKVLEETGVVSRVVEGRTHRLSLEPEALDWYVRSGEPMGKAGAYAIQGLGSRFVTRVEGSYPNVVGLPIAEVRAMCRRLGILVS